MKELRCVGSCLSLFIMAIAFDVIGLVLLFVGIFGDVRLNGAFYGDFLIYSGALVLFASLAWWLMWYVGNIKVEDEYLERRSSAAHSVKQLARKLTERLSRRPQKDSSEKTGSKASTVRNVTWGKSTYFPRYNDQDSDIIKCDKLPKEKSYDSQFTYFHNQGYEDEESAENKGRNPSQEETDSQSQASESDQSDFQDKKPDDQFSYYQNEAYEDSESDVSKPQEKSSEAQPESFSIDDLL